MGITDLLDTSIDRTVVLGYTRVGFALRKQWWPADPPPGALTDRHVLVTGATSGIGQAAAVGLARLGATVHALGRDHDRTARAAQHVVDRVPGAHVEVEVCDVSSLDAVRTFAEDFGSRVERLHALLHNAGALTQQRTVTPEGNELTLATHVLGPFLLTELLTASLRADGDARVLFTSSGGMYAESLHGDDPQYERGTYSGTTAYARTKRMQVSLAELMAEHMRPKAVAVHSMHPGWVDTPGVQESLPRFRALTGPLLRNDEQGADTLVWLSAAAEATSRTGLFWHDRRARPTTYGPWPRQADSERQQLWDFCVRMTASV
ncbi:SDR family NAD(P)-dependent oxidoreductase [Nocardioidaceae bacterium SCSIO 66511]|nr:SDR family NAD(P)-dependent oxidoreductase [Nocardioidaceae bacterium SCSIO 66511]